MFEWRTDEPDTKGEVMVTCQSGRSRWVLPGCYYRRGQWWHTIIEAHDREIDPEGDVEHIGEEEERVLAEVIAWSEYPDPFGMEDEPLIRCKDCKWYYRGGATCMYWDGENNMHGDDYCSRAERKEE